MQSPRMHCSYRMINGHHVRIENQAIGDTPSLTRTGHVFVFDCRRGGIERQETVVYFKMMFNFKSVSQKQERRQGL